MIAELVGMPIPQTKADRTNKVEISIRRASRSNPEIVPPLEQTKVTLYPSSVALVDVLF